MALLSEALTAPSPWRTRGLSLQSGSICAWASVPSAQNKRCAQPAGEQAPINTCSGGLRKEGQKQARESSVEGWEQPHSAPVGRDNHKFLTWSDVHTGLLHESRLK